MCLLSLSLQWLLPPSPFYGSSLANSANYIVRSKEKMHKKPFIGPSGAVPVQELICSLVNRVNWAAFSVTRNGCGRHLYLWLSWKGRTVWTKKMAQSFMQMKNSPYINHRLSVSPCLGENACKVNCHLNLTEAYMVNCVGQHASHRPGPCALELKLLLLGSKR